MLRFAAVVRGEIAEQPISSIGTNLVISEILDAARESARTHQGFELSEKLAE